MYELFTLFLPYLNIKFTLKTIVFQFYSLLYGQKA